MMELFDLLKKRLRDRAEIQSHTALAIEWVGFNSVSHMIKGGFCEK